MRKFLAMLALALSVGAVLPAYAHAATNTSGDNDAAYRAEAGGGAR